MKFDSCPFEQPDPNTTPSSAGGASPGTEHDDGSHQAQLPQAQLGYQKARGHGVVVTMALKFTLVTSAIYLALIGLALIFTPLQFGIGAVPADAAISR